MEKGLGVCSCFDLVVPVVVEVVVAAEESLIAACKKGVLGYAAWGYAAVCG